MPSFLYGAGVVFLLGTLVAGLLRMAWGPSRADRILCVQLFGTTLIGIVLLLGRAWQKPELDNLALVLVFLAALPAFSYNRRLPARYEKREQGRDGS